MDSNHRIKIKIGQHEFEAEGSPEIVQQQFEAFKEMVERTSPNHLTVAAQPSERPHSEAAAPAAPSDAANLSKIMRVDGRLVSLTVRPSDIYDAIFLILYGQKELRQNDAVTGAEVMEGITSTGGFSYVKRVDRYLENAAQDGHVIVIGEHRAKRYRLTNAGYAKAEGLVKEFAAIVP